MARLAMALLPLMLLHIAVATSVGQFGMHPENCPPWLPTGGMSRKPELANTRDHVLFFIAIGSGPKNIGRRMALRDTWLKWCHCGCPLHQIVYRVFTESGPATHDEQNLYGDLVLSANATTGKKDFLRRWQTQVHWAIRHFEFDFLLHVDDDGFLCLPTVVHNLVHAAPKRMFFWAKYFCNDGKVVADENFLLMSADLVHFLDYAINRGVLRATYEGDASFAAHFGFWQHMLNLTILDDRRRFDAQQGYLTPYMRRGKLENCSVAPNTLLGGF